MEPHIPKVTFGSPGSKGSPKITLVFTWGLHGVITNSVSVNLPVRVET